MKIIFLVILLLIFKPTTFAQSRLIEGALIDVNFRPIPFASILIDTIKVSETDVWGKFKLSIPDNTHSITISGVGLSRRNIILSNDCNYLEIILHYGGGCYLSKSLKEVDKIKKKEFKKMPSLHKKAFEQGIFSSPKPCYELSYTSFLNK